MRIMVLMALALLGCDQSGNSPTKLQENEPLDFGNIDLEIKSVQLSDSTITVFNNGSDSIPLRQISIGMREPEYLKGCINSGFELGPSGYLKAKEAYTRKNLKTIGSTDYFELNFDNRIKESNRTNNCILGSGVSVDCCN